MAAARLEGLDAIRGLAACAVVLHHIVLRAEIAPPEYLSVIRSHFGLGVPMFYLISAFTMYHVYFSARQRPDFVRSFFVKRYARLMPLYLVTFALWALIFTARYGGTGIEAIHVPYYMTLTFGVFPSTSYGFVPAAWSIGVEMIFYLGFPVMVARFRSIGALASGLAAALVLSCAFQAGLPPMPEQQYYFAVNPVLFAPVFFAGALMWMVYQRVGLSGMWLIPLALVALVGVSFIPALPTSNAAVQYWWKVTTLLPAFMLVLVAFCASPVRILVNRATVKLGEISYSIYLLHMVVIFVGLNPLVPIIRGAFPDSQLAQFVVASVAVFAVLIPLSMASYRFIEVTGKRLIEGLAGVKRASSASAGQPAE